RSKELAQIGLFENRTDFTPLQVQFLYWLEIYHSLEVDLASKKNYISREVIDSELRADAYLYWRELINNKSEKEIKDLENTDSLHDGAVVFKKRRVSKTK